MYDIKLVQILFCIFYVNRIVIFGTTTISQDVALSLLYKRKFFDHPQYANDFSNALNHAYNMAKLIKFVVTIMT